MNNKEKTVLILLCICFLVGASISFYRNIRDKKNLEKITIKKTSVPGQVQPLLDNDEDTDSIPSTILININTAGQKELEALPGIGPVLAKRIIDYREKNNGFKSKEEVCKVSGIGTKKYAMIKDIITIH